MRYRDFFDTLKEQLNEEELELFKNRNVHLGIFSREHLRYIITGEQFLEARFTKNKIAPYKTVNKGDIVVMKEACGPIQAYFIIDDVEYIEVKNMPMEEIEFRYNDEIFQDDLFWKRKRHSNYATLIRIGEVKKLEPFRTDKMIRQGWITFAKN